MGHYETFLFGAMLWFSPFQHHKQAMQVLNSDSVSHIIVHAHTFTSFQSQVSAQDYTKKILTLTGIPSDILSAKRKYRMQ